MFVVDLVCHSGHLFEGWYDNVAAFDRARAEDELGCPICGESRVEQRPSFAAIGRAGRAPTPVTMPKSDAPAQMPMEMQKALSQVWKFIRAHAEDAGDRFAPRALAMHRGEEEQAPIFGSSTPDERAQLASEGVPFASLPVPDIDQN